MKTADLEVNGTPPPLSDTTCQEFLLEQYWHDNKLVAPANVAYLRCGDTWHRLAFDYGIIFWRRQKDRPCAYSMPELNAETRIDNAGERLGLAGRRLHSYVSRVVPGGSEVAFSFEGGSTLILRNVADHTSCLVEASHAA
jgi:hypothetical protein